MEIRVKKKIFEDEYHEIARLRQKLYQDELREIMLETGVTWQKAREIRLQRKRKKAIEMFERELKQAEKLT